ncbi:hypothetical protein M9H77_30803 [Catharanthus roseus]|uniref:Uncharacterized protein n=1 Tax=Catharanthus roseus TaxID=4058 RepID=A0ACB9ZZ80_CATRO|nr:hypothetical protein M9H77_30803 [Catharanthus roseus]
MCIRFRKRRNDEKKRAPSQAAYSRTVRRSSKASQKDKNGESLPLRKEELQRMDGVPGETTQSSLNSCTSRLTSSPDTFKGKKKVEVYEVILSQYMRLTDGSLPSKRGLSSLSPRDRIAFGRRTR